jgi:glucokinase
MCATSVNSEQWLVADIGATNSRCALLQSHDLQLCDVRVFDNAHHASAADVLKTYIALEKYSIRHCALAVAAPVRGDDVRMINRDWQLNGPSLAKELGLESIRILNDFHAIAYALPALDDQSRIEIGAARDYRDGSMAVLGPGSGLGMAAWIGDRHAGIAMCGEGGHITVAGRNKDEDKIIEKLRRRFGHCSAERIWSGPGLVALHKAMHDEEVATPEYVTENIDDRKCATTMQQFFHFLGSCAADLALITGAFGGVYIAGGIVPACVDQLRDSPFRERFEDKNRYREYMQRIPTYVIMDPYPGLRGLAALVGALNSRQRY